MGAQVGPFRRVTMWIQGAGSDTLKLECGHIVIRNHRAAEPKKARCHNCRLSPSDGHGGGR